MKLGTQLYAVQPLLHDGSKDGRLVHTDATSPLLAAEKIVGTQLSLHGKVAKATVWVMNESYATTLVTVYLPDPASAGA